MQKDPVTGGVNCEAVDLQFVPHVRKKLSLHSPPRRILRAPIVHYQVAHHLRLERCYIMPPTTTDFLRTTLVGLLTSIVLIIVGYKLNDWMSRDRLTIEYIQFKPQSQSLQSKPETAGELQRNPEFAQWGGASPFSPCTSVLSDQVSRSWNAPAIKQMTLCLNSFSDHLAQIIPALEQARTSAAGSTGDLSHLLASVQPDLSADAINRISHATTPREQSGAVMQEIKTAIAIDMQAKDLSSQLLGYLKTYKAERTGELEVWVTVLNGGDTDGLIRPEAALSLSDSNLQPLSIKLAPSDQFLSSPQEGITSSARSIPKRSSTTLVFRLTPQELDRDTRGHVVKDIRGMANLAGSVVLKDIRNSPISSKQFAFPADDDDQKADQN